MSMRKKSILIALLANLFHYYAFAIYAFSAVMLAPMFFHTNNAALTRILGLLTFSLTFFLKPLGGIIFGHLGDKHGRKNALIFSLVAITIATTCIGLIPSYTQIGWFSSILLLMCLFVQGLCTGGQYTGVIIYIQEHTKKEHAAFSCGVVGAIGVFGTLIGTGTSYFFDHFKELGWEWRVPFLLTSIMGFFLYLLMRKMQETTAFIENKNQIKEKAPLCDIIKNHKRSLLSAIFISSVPISMFYIAAIYIPNFYVDQKVLKTSIDPFVLVCLTQILCIFLMPSLGLLADKLGRERQLQLTSALLLVTPIFIFYYMTISNTFVAFVGGIFLFSVFASLYTGPSPAYLSERFPVVSRYSGMGLGIAIGEGLFGGLSPLICVGLQQFFDSKIAAAYFVIFIGVISFVGIFLSKRPLLYRHKPIIRESEMEVSPL